MKSILGNGWLMAALFLPTFALPTTHMGTAWAVTQEDEEQAADSDSKKKDSSSQKSKAAPEGTNVGDKVKDITGEDVEGEEFSLSDYEGKVIMLDFWGDW